MDAGWIAIIIFYGLILWVSSYVFVWLLKPVLPALLRMGWGERATVAFVAILMAIGAVIGVGAGPFDLPLGRILAGQP